ncbi:hypothetical protein CPT_Maine_003 [Staphylococcus phage Maine]|nr:hypothetical protein CPT_Maine_003 [Staphylococcus phage Maine]WDQ44001.1 hypothetical protein ESA2_CDS4 [Staphylococcus phage ESa2]
MIEIRLDNNYSDFNLKVLLKRIKRVAPRELTYGIESVEDIDVNVEPVNPYSDYEHLSEVYVSDLFIVITLNDFVAYYQGERYSGESLDEIIHDMFYDDADPFDLDY